MQQRHIKVNKGGIGHFSWAQPKELQPPKRLESWCKARFIFIEQEIIVTSKTVHKGKLESVLKCKANLLPKK